jgi:hypothetical protein
MGARLSPVLWFCLALAVPALAAAPIDPDVAAASARGNPKAIAKLVKSLASADAAERDAAEEALVILGVEAIPSLRAAISAKEPSAEAALGVLGALGHAGERPLHPGPRQRRPPRRRREDRPREGERGPLAEGERVADDRLV